MWYVHIYADSNGKSHLEDCEFETHPVELAPGVPAAAFTDWMPTTAIQVFRIPPAEWQHDQHHAPRRQILIVLADAIEIEASDGEIRQLHAGDVLLAEDTHGTGHLTRSVDGQELAVAWTPLAEDRDELGE